MRSRQDSEWQWGHVWTLKCLFLKVKGEKKSVLLVLS